MVYRPLWQMLDCSWQMINFHRETPATRIQDALGVSETAGFAVCVATWRTRRNIKERSSAWYNNSNSHKWDVRAHRHPGVPYCSVQCFQCWIYRGVGGFDLPRRHSWPPTEDLRKTGGRMWPTRTPVMGFDGNT